MLAELGVFFLILALAASLLQAAWLVPFPVLRERLAPLLPAASWLQALLIVLAFATLVALRLNNDFSVANVAAHSNLSLPLLYKITGAWGNHEGSMLLWVLVLSVFGLLLVMRAAIDTELAQAGAAIQSALSAGVLLFILLTSNPFERQFPPAADGQALNPILQDIALAIHPPLLYLGYVGFSIVFSLATAALLRGRMDRAWAQFAHPWIMASWSALTLGIGLGSWWAYRELGWGGWWFWDPVENASLMPWLAGTALLHANIVLKKRGALPTWVALLSIITFGLSLLGTFLVRSGALTSVHSFTSDPARGLFILTYMVVALGGALLLFALRAPKIAAPGHMQFSSREGMIVINNIFLLSACATVFLGTIYPLMIEWLQGARLTVGPPYFNKTFMPMMALPLLFAGLVPFMAWKKASLAGVLSQVRYALLAAIAMALLVFSLVHTQAIFAVMGFSLAAWLLTASLQWLARGRGVRGAFATFLAHAGVAVMVAGITGVGLFKQEGESWLAQGESLKIGAYEIIYVSSRQEVLPNYRANRVTLTLRNAKGETLATLLPEYRTYAIRAMATSESAIYHSLAGNVYAVVGQTSPDGRKTSVRAYVVPMIHFIWLGFMLMALAGIIAIIKRYEPALRNTAEMA